MAQKGLKLKKGMDYDEECIMCGHTSHKLLAATPTEPFDGTSCLDLECKSCKNTTYHYTEGFVETE